MFIERRRRTSSRRFGTSPSLGAYAFSFFFFPPPFQLWTETNLRLPCFSLDRLMLVGMGGNNGSTLVATLLANKHGIDWHTKEGPQKPNYIGSVRATFLFSTSRRVLIVVSLRLAARPGVDRSTWNRRRWQGRQHPSLCVPALACFPHHQQSLTHSPMLQPTCSPWFTPTTSSSLDGTSRRTTFRPR